jgi:hypothetical protein
VKKTHFFSGILYLHVERWKFRYSASAFHGIVPYRDELQEEAAEESVAMIGSGSDHHSPLNRVIFRLRAS